jgi:transposase
MGAVWAAGHGGSFIDIVGIDISKAKFGAAQLVGERGRHGTFSNIEAGFGQCPAWLARHRPYRALPWHACMEATGNWGLDLAAFLHANRVQVSTINPARIKTFAGSELARNKTDRLDAGLIARFCRAHAPPAWTPPLPHLRELRELARRCDTLKAVRVQELNRQTSGFASPTVARSIALHLEWLNGQIDAVATEVRQLIEADPTLSQNLALLRGITGFGETSATVLLAELPNIAEFTPGALTAFVSLSPQEHSSGSSVRRPGRISRVGSKRLRGTLYMCALGAKRTNKALAAFVQRLLAAGKPPKVILVAVARKLLVYVHAVIRTQTPFEPTSNAARSI